MTNDKQVKSSGFNDFIDNMAIVYAILVALGFSRLACRFQNDWEHWQLLLISSLVLMRFFFAPSRNLAAIAKATRNRPFWQRVIFLWDVPMLIAHSFVFCALCLHGEADTINVYCYYYSFFVYFLPMNIIWLWSISFRLLWFGEERPKRFFIWSTNNSIHVAIFSILWSARKYQWIDIEEKYMYLLFAFALSNCVFDFLFTAPDYLGFRKEATLGSDKS